VEAVLYVVAGRRMQPLAHGYVLGRTLEGHASSAAFAQPAQQLRQAAGKPATPSDQAGKFVMIGATRPLSRIPGLLVIATLIVQGGTAVAQQPGTGQTPPPAVVVERIEVQEVSDPTEFNARVEAIESVDIRARVRGFLQTVAFEAGEAVQAGDLLFEIEPDQYEAAVASARAQVARAEAAREDAERTLARQQELVERQAAAQAALDEARAAFEIAAAEVEIAQAALRTAELDLSYTRITAPITGQIGRALFTQGNLVARKRARSRASFSSILSGSCSRSPRVFE
jgi:multidrug efflux pump subunit AcrA (membrane-fusion protein)